ncbi:30669_t:CDS:2, partial [Racocetra persica]
MFPQRRSGRWTDQEKQLLETLVQTYGYNWRLIAILMQQTRDQRQIREHYLNHQNPANAELHHPNPKEFRNCLGNMVVSGNLSLHFSLASVLLWCVITGTIFNANGGQSKIFRRFWKLSQNQQPDFAPFGSYQQLDHHQFGDNQQQPALSPPSDSS